MIGAIAGDIIGSVWEHYGLSGMESPQSMDFPLFDSDSQFTDDSVLTVATADVLTSPSESYTTAYRHWFRQYPRRGFGGMFKKWASGISQLPYNSFGNGSAMRVAPVAWAFNTEEQVLDEAKRSAECTHNHPEGIKGAQAVALAIFLARQGKIGQDIGKAIQKRFKYDMDRTYDEIQDGYKFEVSCQKSVPEAIICACISNTWEEAVRYAVALGGDTDTQACMAGAIAEAMYGGVPLAVEVQVKARLDPYLLLVVDTFMKRFVRYGERP
jgi:ADP-ribosylglycohydrolase